MKDLVRGKEGFYVLRLSDLKGRRMAERDSSTWCRGCYAARAAVLTDSGGVCRKSDREDVEGVPGSRGPAPGRASPPPASAPSIPPPPETSLHAVSSAPLSSHDTRLDLPLRPPRPPTRHSLALDAAARPQRSAKVQGPPNFSPGEGPAPARPAQGSPPKQGPGSGDPAPDQPMAPWDRAPARADGAGSGPEEAGAALRVLHRRRPQAEPAWRQGSRPWEIPVNSRGPTSPLKIF